MKYTLLFAALVAATVAVPMAVANPAADANAVAGTKLRCKPGTICKQTPSAEGQSEAQSQAEMDAAAGILFTPGNTCEKGWGEACGPKAKRDASDKHEFPDHKGTEHKDPEHKVEKPKSERLMGEKPHGH